MRQIRKATVTDVHTIMAVMEAAKGIMRSSGNLHQWINGYPSVEVIEADIRSGFGHVVEEDGKIVAYYAFVPSPEPTYARIYDGAWPDDRPYHVIHRMGSIPESHGVFISIMDWCLSCDRGLRVDTHRDNVIMRHCLENYGFTYCGIIHLANGDERLAYQLK